MEIESEIKEEIVNTSNRPKYKGSLPVCIWINKSKKTGKEYAVVSIADMKFPVWLNE